MSFERMTGVGDDTPRFARFSRMVQETIGVQLPASKKNDG
jgi:hypothetical protein